MAKKQRTERDPVEHVTGAKERAATITRVVSQIEKQYGKGSIMQLSGNLHVDAPCISTGSISLDLALGGRGLPRGRVAEFFGPEASGKTTLALTIIANAQREGGVAAFIDAEHAFDAAWGKRIGIDLESLLVSQPDTGEQALDICELLVRSGAVDVIVIDSVAALVPKAEIEGQMGDTHVGLQARLMSQALRKLTGSIAKSRTAVIFLNQIREKIGVMYGNPETTPGGRALKFYASVRIDLRRITTLKAGETAVGSRTRAKVVKNKVAPRRSRTPSSTSSSTAASRPRATSWTWGRSAASSKRAAPGSRSGPSASARATTGRASSSRRAPTSPRKSARRSSRRST